MRILHIDPDDMANPVSGGGPIRTFEICRRLASRHEITVLTPTFEGSTPELVRDGVRYVRLGRKVGDHGSSHHITFFFALPAAVRRFSYDLLVEDFMPPSSVTFNPLFARGPVVASVQWRGARNLARQYRLPFHWMEWAGLSFYRNFVVLTQDMRRQLEARRPKAAIRVIGNGVGEDLFEIADPPGDSILYLGRVDMHLKGVGILLQAYAMLAEPRPRLVIAGFGWERDKAEALARQLGVAGTIVLTGRVDAAERRTLLRRCRFVVFPSREETFGLVVAEACAAGRPVVHFDIPPMNEIASRAGNIAVPAFEVGALAAAMATLVREGDDAVLARGRACRQRVSGYRWDEVASRQEDFYGEVHDRYIGARRRQSPNP